jgi:hypothetical protein
MSPIVPPAANRCTKMVANLRASHAGRSSYFSMCRKTRPISCGLYPIAPTSKNLPGIASRYDPVIVCSKLIPWLPVRWVRTLRKVVLTGAPTVYAGEERGSPPSSAAPILIMRPLQERVVYRTALTIAAFSPNGFRMRSRVRSRLLLRRPWSQW